MLFEKTDSPFAFKELEIIYTNTSTNTVLRSQIQHLYYILCVIQVMLLILRSKNKEN